MPSTYLKNFKKLANLSPIFVRTQRYASNLSPAVESQKVVTKRDIPSIFELDGVKVVPDSFFNISSNLTNLFKRRLLFEQSNPLFLLKQKIINHFNVAHRKIGNRSPIFTVCENEARLVSVFDNFDSLLTPINHVSRSPSDTYYANSGYCLRAHTSAHQFHLLKQGFDNFIVVGDVYRRDEIDRTHYPCFHQMEGVRTYSAAELFGSHQQLQDFSLFSSSITETVQSPEKQAVHSEDAAKVLVLRLKNALEELTRSLFGKNIEYRWVDAYFPFTHPSFELEVLFNGKWLEVLGCGVIEQKILDSAGAGSKVGWAFGLGLERLAMALYEIPDIRLFWSQDTGFLNQFRNLKPEDSYKYKPVSVHPQLIMDLSFWIPLTENFLSNGALNEAAKKYLESITSDVRDIIRNIGGDLVEQVEMIDQFLNTKKQKFSHCYRIVYRSNERALTKDEINVIHKKIESQLSNEFGVEIR